MRLHHFSSRQRVTMRVAVALVLLFAVGAWLTTLAVEGELESRIDEQLRDDAEIATLDEFLDIVSAGPAHSGCRRGPRPRR